MQQSLWTDITVLLDEFVEYLEEEKLDMYAANCLNAGYRSLRTTDILVAQKVADRLMCTLMTGALFFMNGWHKQSASRDTRDSHSAQLKAHIRCAIVNIFMSILLASPCRSQMGINNAWYTMKQLESGETGLLTKGTCRQGVFADIKIGEFDMETQITTWLKSKKSLTEKFASHAIQSTCTKSLAELGVARQDANDMDERIELKDEEKEAISALGREMKTIVEEVKKAAVQCAKGTGACMKSIEAVTGRNPEGDDSEGKETKSVASDTPAPNVPAGKDRWEKEIIRPDTYREDAQKTTAPPKSPPPEQTEETPAAPAASAPAAPGAPRDRARSENPPAAPGEQPPSQSSSGSGSGSGTPTPGPQGGAQEAGTHGTSTETKAKDSDATSAGTATCPSSSGKSARVSISCATTSDEELGKTPELTKLLQQEEQEREKAPISPSPNSGTGSDTRVDSTASETTAKGPEPQPEPGKGTVTGSTIPSSGTDTTSTGPHATKTDKNDGQAGSTDAVVDGGNDDPPPLNPPKPKPNPNPDQSGSSSTGGGSGPPTAAGTENGAGGGHGVGGPGGGAGAKPSAGSVDAGPGSTGPQNPGSSAPGSSGTGSTGGPGAGASHPSGGQGPRNNQVPPTLPSPTPFDPKDLIPYTPAIIPAVVGIGIIAFFLWKYFAYLGHKRRRTYRTVRDVPSPPLDDDILAHLQRGELPQPDYGYTMVTQPASTSGRGRPPRVHKRTIIELHLDVLHECEATNWENVKDDYLQILVEEFANDLEPHATGYSSSPASSSNHDSPGTTVSFTMDPHTDIERTHASPRNAEHPDPCSGMDTIQLPTDSCPLNDPDPWSCMETIQLQTDPCAPHDPDPWSCMETIPLAPHPSASNHGDETAACTHWINWIDRNKYLLRACTGQPWFLQLKADWKQYLRAHMVANGASSEHRTAATLERKKLDAWKEWVAQQHRQMCMYNAQEWCQRLLHNVEAATAPQKGAVPGVDTALAVETVMGTEDVLQVRDVPRSQLHPQPYMQKALTAKIWILLLALVIEQCELERNLQQTELYVDELLDKLCN
ncbi:hypothetical protein AK88_04295 [Plasmodium fragile]|uniref:Schizont-infected cell agglutination C-terminal domain-containing protein n=1 Tax=Plasmodium fragile TaxID=5857 RepID=A0A0D9QGC4_PLAFR|nr:uncharacterized protein AK88_04295 [Plasmodium fragile]KJP86038.1 hypothetical protein AK88_04295 [Plasmodium fragile]